jgi:hypothetical protein
MKRRIARQHSITRAAEMDGHIAGLLTEKA